VNISQPKLRSKKFDDNNNNNNNNNMLVCDVVSCSLLDKLEVAFSPGTLVCSIVYFDHVWNLNLKHFNII